MWMECNEAIFYIGNFHYYITASRSTEQWIELMNNFSDPKWQSLLNLSFVCQILAEE